MPETRTNTKPAVGLTTTQSPFIEELKVQGELYIDQPYELYSEENHQSWAVLYERILPRWHKYAHPRFLEGVEKLSLDPHAVPRLEDINRFLKPLTGFSARAVSGYIPAYRFFDSIRQRVFPTTITIRDKSKLDYLPEPDIFHDVSGHVPMHTDQRFADVLVRFGEVARAAARMVAEVDDKTEQLRQLDSIIKAMARFFWFTVEFGLMRNGNELCVYGSGILSSFGELEYSIESPDVQRFPFQIEWVINQYFEIDHYQPLLFIVDSFDHLFDQVDELERLMLRGELNNVSPGEPLVNEEDLQSFLEADTST